MTTGAPATAPAADRPAGALPAAWRAVRRVAPWVALILKAVLLNVVVPWVFVAFVLRNVPVKTAFEFDRDEGINLMKAVLYQDGHPLYREIWSDQPPLFTALLSWLFHFTPASRYAARLLVVGMAALLVWAFALVLDLTLGLLPALAGAAMLALSYRFARLSGSIMIGLPGLALTAVAILCLLLYRRAPRRLGPWLLPLAGAVYALSLQTKLFTISWLPFLALAAALPVRRKTRPAPGATAPDEPAAGTDPAPQVGWPRRAARGLAPLGLFLAGLAATFVATGLYFHSLDYRQLVEAQVGPSVKEIYKADDNAAIMRTLLTAPGRDGDYLPLAALGLGAALLKLRGERLLPAGMLAASALALYYHRPIQPNHQHLLLSLPLVWLAAAGLAPATDFWRQRGFRYRRPPAPGLPAPGLPDRRPRRPGVTFLLWTWRAAEIALAVGAAALAYQEYPHLPPKLRQVEALRGDSSGPGGRDAKMIALLRQHGGGTRWALTDRPIYAFEAGLRVPPPLAVMSLKRFRTHNLTSEQVLDVLKTYRPEQVLLARFHGHTGELAYYAPELRPYAPALYQYLGQYYDKLLDERGAVYYVLKTLPHEPPPKQWWEEI